MHDAELEVRAVERDIALAQKRLSDLEALAHDDGPHGASPTLVRALMAEWRGRLQALQDRREDLLRRIPDAGR